MSLTAQAPARLGVDQTRAPLLAAVQREAHGVAVRAHCPGHLGGSRAHPELTTLVGRAALSADVWLDTPTYDRVRRDAEVLAADAWRGQRAWLLGNGSTAGNLAWLVAALSDGEPVVVGRDAHTSVLAGLVLSGARPVWVAPRLHPVLGIPLGVDPADLVEALGSSGARHVVLTSPGYAGTCADIPALVAAAARLGAATYVDQAWGAHLPFTGLDGPVHALDAGAAGCVVSVHKTGTAMSSGAVLVAGHGAGDDLVARVDRAVRMTQTTSPLLPLLASVDAARRDLAVGGVPAVAEIVGRARALGRRLTATAGLQVIGHEELGLGARRVDPVKLVVDVSGLGLSGWEVEERLRRDGVAPEGADDRRVYAVLAGEVADDAFAAALERVASETVALQQVFPGQVRHRQVGHGQVGHGQVGQGRVGQHGLDAVPGGVSAGVWAHAVRAGRQMITPRQAHHARAHAVPLALAVGRIAAEPVVPYPPGVPVLLPGEQVDAAAVALLRSVVAGGGHVHGCADPTLATLRVVA